MKILINKTIVGWKLAKELTTAGIPNNGVSVLKGGTELEIFLQNEAQAPQAQTVVNNHGGIDTNVTAKAARRQAANTALASLVGRNISSINNTADRDALMKSVCYILKICDENGVIVADAFE